MKEMTTEDIFKSLKYNTFYNKYINEEIVIKDNITLPLGVLNILGKCKKVYFLGEVKISSYSILGGSKLYYDIGNKGKIGNIIFSLGCKI